jgi:hypothetical protein
MSNLVFNTAFAVPPAAVSPNDPAADGPVAPNENKTVRGGSTTFTVNPNKVPRLVAQSNPVDGATPRFTSTELNAADKVIRDVQIDEPGARIKIASLLRIIDLPPDNPSSPNTDTLKATRLLAEYTGVRTTIRELKQLRENMINNPGLTTSQRSEYTKAGQMIEALTELAPRISSDVADFLRSPAASMRLNQPPAIGRSPADAPWKLGELMKSIGAEPVNACEVHTPQLGDEEELFGTAGADRDLLRIAWMDRMKMNAAAVDPVITEAESLKSELASIYRTAAGVPERLAGGPGEVAAALGSIRSTIDALLIDRLGTLEEAGQYSTTFSGPPNGPVSGSLDNRLAQWREDIGRGDSELGDAALEQRLADLGFEPSLIRETDRL